MERMSKTREISQNINFLSWLKQTVNNDDNQSSNPSIQEELPEIYQKENDPPKEGSGDVLIAHNDMLTKN